MNNLNDRTRLPSPLRDEPYTAAIAGALGELGADALSIVRSVYEQLSPKTATWGLSAWEEITGILPAAGSTLEERRAAVVAQLCSRGTTNAEAIERLAASLTGYGAEVVENFGDYSFARCSMHRWKPLSLRICVLTSTMSHGRIWKRSA